MRTCTKIFFKKFMFLILTFLLYCNYTFTAQSTPDVHFYNVQEGENICINSTNFPFYLILNQISFQNLIYFYRIMAAGETASLDYVSTSSSMPYATRAESVGSSFSIHALSSGPCIISTFTTTQCKDGIELTTAATRTIDFNTTTDNYFYNITSGSTKCIFISENQSFSISGELQMHGLYDKVCVITSTGSNCYQQSETFQTEVTSQYYAFITIDMNNTIQTDRSFSLTTESNIAGDIPGPSNRFIAHAQKQRFLWEVRRADFEGKEISLKRRPASPQQADRHDIFSRQTTHHSPRQGYQWSVISSAFPPSPKRSKDTPLRPTKNSSYETFEERLTPVSE